MTVNYTSAGEAYWYRELHGFGQAKFDSGGLVLGSSLLTLPPVVPLKMTLNLKVVKIDLKIIILRHLSKSVTHSVQFLV